MKDSLTKAVDQIMVNAAAQAYDAKAKPEDAIIKAEDATIKVEDATSGQQLAATPSEITLTAEQLGKPVVPPFGKRELKTTAELLKMKIEKLMREFEADTGSKIDHVRYASYDSLSLSIRSTEPDEHGLAWFYV
jgi:hypothetical protein